MRLLGRCFTATRILTMGATRQSRRSSDLFDGYCTGSYGRKFKGRTEELCLQNRTGLQLRSGGLGGKFIRRKRSWKRMLSLEEEQRILENAPPYLRVAIVLLAQTGGRTYSEGFSLRWDQLDFSHKVMFFGGDTKTEGSSEPVPLTGLAHDVLLSWKKEQAGKSPYLFP